MIEFDGAAGGGQLLRTALSLSARDGEPFRMSSIRGGRSEPGLRPQHLAAVQLLEDITDAEVSGAVEGSSELEFDPGPVRPGTYEVDIGTAGSTTLLFDAVLPLATIIDAPLVIQATGGTDVKWSPTTDYARLVKYPLLRRHGIGVAVDIDRRGFYPVGGGEATVWLWPSDPHRFELEAIDETGTAWITSLATMDLGERDVAERQRQTAQDTLKELGVDVVDRRCHYVEAASTGSAIAVRLDRGPTIVGGDGHGERGTPAETVADQAVAKIKSVIESGASVDQHLADQLMVFLALLGGHMTAPTTSDHVETNATVLEGFGYQIRLGEGPSGTRIAG